MLKIRSLISQLCASLPFFFLKFGYGASTGFAIIIVAELSKEDSEITMTLDELSWHASLAIVAPITVIITGFLMQYFGSRIVAAQTASMYMLSCTFYYYSTNSTTIIISELFCIMTATNALCAPHISEITEPRFRGRFLAIAYLVSGFGSFFSLLLGSLLYWRHIALVNLTFSLTAALLLLVTPNSPTWLANKGRFEEAEKSLCWLRGWVKPINVQDEFRAIIDSVQSSKKSTSNEKNVDDCRRQRLQKVFQPYLQRSFYIPLGIMCLILTLHFASGLAAMQMYSAVIFRQMNSPIDVSITTSSIGAMGIIGQCVILIFVRRVGKLKLALFSLFLVIIAQLTIAIVGFLNLGDDYLWIPPIALMVAIFAIASGGSTLAYMINSEIFSSSTRYIGTSCGLSIGLLVLSIINKLFWNAVQVITLYGVFLFFAVVNVAALFVYYFFVPETEGKSLQEIEEHFKDIKSLEEKKGER